MAEQEIKKHNFYQEYLWSPQDFLNLQNWMGARFEGIFEGFLSGSLLSGLKVSLNSGLGVLVDPGIAVTPLGRMLYVPTQQSTEFASPVGNPAKSLLVLRPKDVNEDFIQEPLAPENSVPLTVKQTYELIVLNGTPAANPSYPAKQANDVAIMGVTLAAGQTTLAFSDFDFGAIDRPKKKLRKVSKKVETFNVADQDDILEGDCTASGVNAYLPALQGSQGKEFTFIKTDGSANVYKVSGADPIDGFTEIDLLSQNDKIKVVACSSMWRTL